MSHSFAHLPLPNCQETLASLNAVKSVKQQSGCLNVVLSFPFPAQHLHDYFQAAISQETQQNVQLTIEHNILTHKVQTGVETIKGVKNIIAIASGKGGVGKSTTTANLAQSLQKMGARVGVLDADLYGPSQPIMLGVADQQPESREQNMLPVINQDGIQIMSIGFLVQPEQAIVWRGAMIVKALHQLLFQTEWDNLDYLLIDLPPGTGDVQLTLAQKIPVTGAIIVTTPQDIALLDAKKAIDMFDKVNIPILGVIENMSIYVCSHCGHAEHLFGQDGGKQLAQTLNVPLLAQLPLSLPIREAMDKGEVAQLHTQQAFIADLYQQAAFQAALTIAKMGRDYSHRFGKIMVQS
ncbi:MAG: iron-sulfur cluster carrier protein ApbC [Neisseriaceae bacterium]|nr:iron-sulfur cluster carrier protein ApbC [Neisseriaceae bacterium]